ncbi:MAG: hypothetical protein NC342_02195 [Pseudoflavonifractor sp.]|nr:hypothetical protein [Alloprevotella sp.]MCM1116332.1 hypothetical protein [Pseudoflavonifractor sp.]
MGRGISTRIFRAIDAFHNRYIIWRRLSQWRKLTAARVAASAKPETALSDDEYCQATEFFRPFGIKPGRDFVALYKHVAGSVDPRMVPDDIYHSYIDPFFCDWQLALKLDNKTLYPMLFPEVEQPETIVYRQNGFWKDSRGAFVTAEDATQLIIQSPKAFIKQAADSEGGNNIFVIDDACRSERHINEAIAAIKGDIMVQRGITQCKELNAVYPDSINTLRIFTFLRRDGSVKVCSAILRMGVGGAKIDNSSQGGINVGIAPDGRLKSMGHGYNGVDYPTHPTTHCHFDEIVIPSFDRAIEIVKREAAKLPYFRIISWDIAIDGDNRPILIEANFKYSGIEVHQYNNGPIFGDETVEILSEVFPRRRGE